MVAVALTKFEQWSLTREFLKQYLTEKQNGYLQRGRLRELVTSEKWSLGESWLYSVHIHWLLPGHITSNKENCIPPIGYEWATKQKLWCQRVTAQCYPPVVACSCIWKKCHWRGHVVVVRLCSSRKYPYFPHGRFFVLHPPPPRKFQFIFIHCF